ncbi:hypothetical protein C4569_02520 [Candidatus Parcubacteria bacterium]|nr:MAG: hypothetical protein C4569_02520 [Candidatus Parcubacteria bacterium]
MDHSIKVGLCFGMTSGIITTLGLMVGLHSGTHLKTVVIGGILTIAVADAFSDALGIHISEESENKHTEKQIWLSTLATFFAKFFLATSFMVPVVLLRLDQAMIVSIVWGTAIISALSYFIARDGNESAIKVIFEHLFIIFLVVTITHFIGDLISRLLY